MATGWLTWTCLLLTAGSSGGDDVVHMNQRGFQIPIRIQPERQGDVRELILYTSKDEGRTWGIYNRAAPANKAFDYWADKDGLLYFSVAVLDKRGVQEPADIYKAPVGMKVCVDTVKPVVRLVSADRVGPDEVQVVWEARDDRPEWTSFKLEWKANDSPVSPWTPLPVQPSERGNHRFRVHVPGDINIRLVLRDQAGNDGADEKLVPSSNMRQDRALSLARNDDLPPPTPPVPTPSVPAPAPAPVISAPSPSIATPAPSPPITSSVNASPVSNPPMPSRGALPALKIVNKRQTKLEFDVTRFGPSGLGGVEVFVSGDEGATWEKAPGEAGVSLPVSPEVPAQGAIRGTVQVQVPSDGKVYGFYLVVKSRAGLGKPPPRPGDVPHVRLECDTTQPTAELYAPQPDSSRAGSLVLSWKAEDRNLAQNPISLEFAANATGPWEFIGDAQLPNTGRFTWQVPAKTPPKVYLKLTVRDTAGNVAVAQTPEPVLIDLYVPEVGNVTVGR